MKKLLKISAVILAVGVILCGVGAFMTHRDGVSPAVVYNAMKTNLNIGESNVEYTEPVRFDLSGVKGASDSNSVGYELNEFNTLELYSENCAVEFVITNGDKMTATVEDGSLLTAITGGTLYIQAVSENASGELTIGMPDSYKGGFVIGAVGGSVTAPPIESAMDLSFNMCSSKLTLGSVIADNVTGALSGSTLDIGSVTSNDNFRLAAESSELSIKTLSAKSISLTANNTGAKLQNILGSFTADMRTSTLNAGFSPLSGNITLDMNTGSADLLIPKDASVSLVHDEQYGVFRDKTKSAQNGGANQASHYTMETNIKFAIVTVGNLE